MVRELLPWWGNKNLQLAWYDGGKWEKYPVTNLNGNQFFTSDHAGISIQIKESHFKECDSAYSVEVEITPNQDGTITGVQLLLPLDPSFQCTWKPHLSPEEEMVIGDKAFRSPAICLENDHLLT